MGKEINIPYSYLLMIVNEEIGGFIQVSDEEGQHDIKGKECIHQQING